jgi:hypothetical protein
VPQAADLAELRRVLSFRGTLVLATGAKRGSESELRADLQKSGFAVDEVRRIRGSELVVRALRKEIEARPAS